MKPPAASPNAQLRASRQTFDLEVDGKPRRLGLFADSGENIWHVRLDGMSFEVNARLLEPGILSLIIDGNVYRCVLDESPVETGIEVDRARFVVALDDPRSLAARRQRGGATAGQQVIKAPMPGRIVRVIVAQGQAVQTKQPVIAIEAMKMQNELRALRAGTIREIRVE
jgi:biotin carboxyl carrier protein